MTESSIIYQPNIITQAKYTLSEYETRILLMVIVRIQNELNKDSVEVNRDLFGEADHKIYFELKELMLDATENSHSRLKKGLKSLQHRDFEIDNDDVWFNVGLIESPVYDKHTHKWCIKISSLLLPYLISVAKGHTQYQIQSILRLNPYGQRIYMIMSQFADTGKYRVDAHKLYTILNLESKYKKYLDFKHWVLLPAMKEISKLFNEGNSDLYFTLNDGKRKDKEDEWSRTLEFKIICPTRNNKRAKFDYEKYDRCYRYIIKIMYASMPKNPKLCNKLTHYFSNEEYCCDFAEKLLKVVEKAESENKHLTDYAGLIVHIAKNDFKFK